MLEKFNHHGALCMLFLLVGGVRDVNIELVSILIPLFHAPYNFFSFRLWIVFKTWVLSTLMVFLTFLSKLYKLWDPSRMSLHPGSLLDIGLLLVVLLVLTTAALLDLLCHADSHWQTGPCDDACGILHIV